MSLTITVSPMVARRLALLANREVSTIGLRLAEKGAAGIGGVMSELREITELITQLEAAGVRVRGDSAPAPAPSPVVAAPATAARVPDVPLSEADDAPPPAVVAARTKRQAAGPIRVHDAVSGP